VLAQTFRDFEIIVVNDGSTDGTEAVLRRYRDRITCITQGNRGLAASRQEGLKASHGPWIAFLDADDIWVPHKLERQINHIASHPECGMVTTDVLSFEGEQVVSDSLKDRYRVRSGYVAEHLLFGNWITPSAAMVRRECFAKVRTFDVPKPSFGEDWLMWMQIAPHYRICFIDEVLVRRRIHSNNMSRVNEEQQFQCLLRNFAIVQKLVPEIANQPELVRKALYRVCVNRASRNLADLRMELARDKLRRAIGYRPTSPLAYAYFTLSLLPKPLLGLAKRKGERGKVC
jgi:glycosyltransferase involved in cell wall biosynthesis